MPRGVDVDEFAPRISWIFNTHNNFFEEVAKYRALRRMWAKLLKERFGAKDPHSWMLRTHIQTGGATLTAQQPENNIVRAAIQALASVLGGVQSMALSCYDEALAIPTEEAQRIALRTQQIIAHETGVTDTVDPFGGSYYVERLTNEIEQARPGVHRPHRGHGRRRRGDRVRLHAARDPGGRRQPAAGDRVRRARRRRRQQVPRRGEEPSQDLPREHRGRQRPDRAPRAGSAPSATPPPPKAALDRLRETARGDDNLMPAILDAVRAYATLGEICGELRQPGASTAHPPSSSPSSFTTGP